MNKKTDGLIFLKEFMRGGLHIEIETWNIVDKNVTGIAVDVRGRGFDGMLYDAKAHISKSGKIKNITVNENSGRWE